MTAPFRLGCTYNVVPLGVEVPPLARFQAVKDAEVFDYINWLPAPAVLADCVAAAERTGIPMTTGNLTHTLGRNDAMLTEAMRNAARAGLELVNVMLQTRHADGHELTDDEIVGAFLTMAEAGDAVGVKASFEVHVDCWSEKFKRVTPVARQVAARGVPFRLTVDYSHVIFKIENPAEQEVSEVRADVEAGRVVLDPYAPGNLYQEWLELGVVEFVQFRPVAPNNPPNVWGRNPNGSQPRGIFYPMTAPAPGEWHAFWHPYKLEAAKEGLRTALRYHLAQPQHPVRYVIAEVIPQPDYAMGSKLSLIEQNAACAHWIRAQWAQLAAMHGAGIPLVVT
jgi:hypothetical protein